VELEVLVEARGFVVDGVDQHRSGSELAAASYAAAEGVDEKVAAECAALFGPGDG
jgi:predicted alpha-1,6-mannanase (GH76 family)